MSDERDTLVVGDVHGHLDRLEALVEQEIADRGRENVTIVQLGDLGHFGHGASPTGDALAWKAAADGLVDYVLWGNHDRAVVDSSHLFGGYERPGPKVAHVMRSMESEGRLLMALEAHGWLITHAGLHGEFEHQEIPDDVNKFDAGDVARWINERARSGDTEPVIDAIGRSRGGSSPHGGILWRDRSETLWHGFPQVFGHTANHEHLVTGSQDSWYCIDVGGKGGSHDPEAQCLAGIWLPSQRIVRVDRVGC